MDSSQELAPFWLDECLFEPRLAGCLLPPMQARRYFPLSKTLRRQPVATLSSTRIVASNRARPLWDRLVLIVSAESLAVLTIYLLCTVGS